MTPAPARDSRAFAGPDIGRQFGIGTRGSRAIRPRLRMAAGVWLLAGCQVGDAQAGLCEWVQPVGGDRGSHLGQRLLHEPQMQRADDVLVVLCHLAERGTGLEVPA